MVRTWDTLISFFFVTVSLLLTMALRSVALNPIVARRSIARYSPDKVAPAIVDRALEAAVLAPNHFLSAPWRFYTLGPETVQGKILSALPADKAKAFEQIPHWMIVTMHSEHDFSSKLWLEDHAATSCAIQNFLLSLATEGIGSKWMTGALGVGPEKMLEAVDAKEGEHFMGAIWYGIPEKELSEGTKAPRKKRTLEECRVDLP